MDSSFTQRWMRKFRILTISLIFSGSLNIGLLAAFIARVAYERHHLLMASEPRAASAVLEPTNLSQLEADSLLSFRELCSLLTNADPVEDGLTRRDLALSALVACHDFNLEKAIGGPPPQRRALAVGERTMELYPGLSDDQFQAIVRYAYLERWPLTARGLFFALQKNPRPHDEALLSAFCLTSEFDSVHTLFQKSDAPLSAGQIAGLLSEGTWPMLEGFAREQAQMPDFGVERRRRFLLSYLAVQSSSAADLLLQTDFAFALKRLNDPGLFDLLNCTQPSEKKQKFCIDLLQSARSDAIHAKSAESLYRMAGAEMPQPFDRAQALARFLPPAPIPPKEAAAVAPKAGTYAVQTGDSLWKIARRFHVKVEDLIALNHLEKDRIQPKMVLKIPDPALK